MLLYSLLGPLFGHSSGPCSIVRFKVQSSRGERWRLRPQSIVNPSRRNIYRDHRRRCGRISDHRPLHAPLGPIANSRWDVGRRAGERRIGISRPHVLAVPAVQLTLLQSFGSLFFCVPVLQSQCCATTLSPSQTSHPRCISSRPIHRIPTRTQSPNSLVLLLSPKTQPTPPPLTLPPAVGGLPQLGASQPSVSPVASPAPGNGQKSAGRCAPGCILARRLKPRKSLWAVMGTRMRRNACQRPALATPEDQRYLPMPPYRKEGRRRGATAVVRPVLESENNHTQLRGKAPRTQDGCMW
ncbi:uncharacterized protein LY89DRAFT_184049 [Mollisia scopiformis]|uniref:Uncharacterized protein n=1 Tax=Mollisia scopiformis TaxID=149040 RepID=A0A194XTG7_MOLSC|nr:uncharacterized protein LY89DRAFT_184049 [Mollisia scopiformis]KUJ23503.1 hypothetical protein LY89DRAFT_184049 [Mollisia scopiformis]